MHQKVQAQVREGADGNVPQGNAPAAYFTTSLTEGLDGAHANLFLRVRSEKLLREAPVL